MAAKKKNSPHPCIAQVNKALEPQGSRLIGTITLTGTTTPIIVATESTIGKKRSVLLTANFCPFCGADMRVSA